MRRLGLLAPLVLGSCGTTSLLESTPPWIQASWRSGTAKLSPSQVGVLEVQAGAYGGGTPTVLLLLERNQNYTPASLKLDEFGYGRTTLAIADLACESGVSGPVFDSLTVRLRISESLQASTRLAVACQAAPR